MLTDRADRAEFASLERKISDFQSQVLRLPTSSRDHAYSLALIEAIAEFSQSRKVRLNVFTTAESETGTADAKERYGNRIDVEVHTELMHKTTKDRTEDYIRQDIELTFLKSITNSKLPRSMHLTLIHTSNGARFSDRRIGPSIGDFSPMELLLELNLAGFFVSNVTERTMPQAMLELQIRHREGPEKATVFLDFASESKGPTNLVAP